MGSARGGRRLSHVPGCQLPVVGPGLSARRGPQRSSHPRRFGLEEGGGGGEEGWKVSPLLRAPDVRPPHGDRERDSSPRQVQVSQRERRWLPGRAPIAVLLSARTYRAVCAENSRAARDSRIHLFSVTC